MKKSILSALALLLCALMLLTATACDTDSLKDVGDVLGDIIPSKDPLEKFNKNFKNTDSYQIEYSITYDEIAISINATIQYDGNIICKDGNILDNPTYTEIVDNVKYEYTKENDKWIKKKLSNTDEDIYSKNNVLATYLNPDNFEKIEDSENVYKQKAGVELVGLEDATVTVEDTSCTFEDKDKETGMNTTLIISKLGEIELTLPDAVDAKETETETEASAIVINKLGEKVITENSEFTIEYVDITKDVVPPQKDDWYNHYEADEGKVYVDICFAYKNTNTEKIYVDDAITADMKYAGKYNYTGFSCCEEDNRSSFISYTYISPLATEYVHYLFEVPEEVKTSGDSIEITFTIDGNNYSYTHNK